MLTKNENNPGEGDPLTKKKSHHSVNKSFVAVCVTEEGYGRSFWKNSSISLSESEADAGKVSKWVSSQPKCEQVAESDLCNNITSSPFSPSPGQACCNQGYVIW